MSLPLLGWTVFCRPKIAGLHVTNNPPPRCGIPSGCCFFTAPWTVTRSSLRVLRWVAAAGAPAGVVVVLAGPSSWHTGGCAGCCGGRFSVFAAHPPPPFAMSVAARNGSPTWPATWAGEHGQSDDSPSSQGNRYHVWKPDRDPGGQPAVTQCKGNNTTIRATHVNHTCQCERGSWSICSVCHFRFLFYFTAAHCHTCTTGMGAGLEAGLLGLSSLYFIVATDCSKLGRHEGHRSTRSQAALQTNGVLSLYSPSWRRLCHWGASGMAGV